MSINRQIKLLWIATFFLVVSLSGMTWLYWQVSFELRRAEGVNIQLLNDISQMIDCYNDPMTKRPKLGKKAA